MQKNIAISDGWTIIPKAIKPGIDNSNKEYFGILIAYSSFILTERLPPGPLNAVVRS